MHSSWLSVLAALGMLLVPVADAVAQQRQPRAVKPSRVEIGGGLGMGRTVRRRHARCDVHRQSTGRRTGSVRLLSGERAHRSGLVGSGWVGFNVTDSVGIEAGFAYSQPSLRTDITADVEGAPPTSIVTTTFTQTQVEGNVLYHFNRSRFDNDKTVPFLFAGAGVLTQRDSEDGIDETGQIYQAGIGFKWFSRVEQLRAKGVGVTRSTSATCSATAASTIPKDGARLSPSTRRRRLRSEDRRHRFSSSRAPEGVISPRLGWRRQPRSRPVP